MASGARGKSGAPMFETVVFQKQMYCIEESTCDIAGIFRLPLQLFGAPCSDLAPRSDLASAPGELCTPCPPSLRPWLGIRS